MNTFWLKIAGLVVAVIGLIVLINALTGKSGPERPHKTIYDQWEKDEKRLSAEPQFKEPPVTQQTTQPTGHNHTIQPSKSVEPPKPQFKKLSFEEELQAQRLWEWVKNQRKMGRLPVMGYGQMVKTCREIIQRWPESEYAFYAKRALADLPEHYRKMYNITDEEIDLGNLK